MALIKKINFDWVKEHSTKKDNQFFCNKERVELLATVICHPVLSELGGKTSKEANVTHIWCPLCSKSVEDIDSEEPIPLKMSELLETNEIGVGGVAFF